MAGSLRYRGIKILCFNAQSVQCKRQLYNIPACKIQWFTLQYRSEKAT